MRTDDITLQLHEQLKNLDGNWLKRLLCSIAGENTQLHPGQTQPLTATDDTNGTWSLLTELLKPSLICESAQITRKPLHLEVSHLVSLSDAHYRIIFIGHDIRTWETSSIERLERLDPTQLHSPLRMCDWMITIQGSLPTPLTVSEQQVLPRLKLAVLPPSFDFTKLRQQLVEMKMTTHVSVY